MIDKMREEFEKFYSKEFGYREDNPESMFETFCDDGESHEYYRLGVRVAWITWQASRAALCVELPSFENGSLRGYNGDCNEANMVIDCISDSLDEAGVRYK